MISGRKFWRADWVHGRFLEAGKSAWRACAASTGGGGYFIETSSTL